MYGSLYAQLKGIYQTNFCLKEMHKGKFFLKLITRKASGILKASLARIFEKNKKFALHVKLVEGKIICFWRLINLKKKVINFYKRKVNI